jgi:hypothetical protein
MRKENEESIVDADNWSSVFLNVFDAVTICGRGRNGMAKTTDDEPIF